MTTRRDSTAEIAIVQMLLEDELSRSKRLRQIRTRVLRAQRSLRLLVSDEAWKAYLAVEAAVNARADHEFEIVCRRLLTVQPRRVL